MRKACIAGLMATIASVMLLAQSGIAGDPTPGSGDHGSWRVPVTCNPIGATVEMEGDYTIVGRTPFFLTYPMPSAYRVKVTMKGFEDYKGYIKVPRQQTSPLSFRLKRKSRLKTALRSSVLAGWGHWYSDRKLMGGALTILQVAAASGFLDQHLKYRDRKSAYENAVKEYQSMAPDAKRIGRAIAVMNAREGDMKTTKDRRDAWLMAAAGVWTFSLIDAIVSYPASEYRFEERRTVIQLSSLTGGDVTVALSRKF